MISIKSFLDPANISRIEYCIEGLEVFEDI